jgi:hypothetical protein
MQDDCDNTEYEEWFDFDSGSDGSLSISKEYFMTNNLAGKLKKLGESGSIGTQVSIL